VCVQLERTAGNRVDHVRVEVSQSRTVVDDHAPILTIREICVGQIGSGTDYTRVEMFQNLTTHPLIITVSSNMYTFM
jgi:hypothetical protein